MKRIVDLAKSKDFGHSLFRSTAYWRLIQKKTILQELSFRCTAKRATSVGKKILPSSIFGRAFGLALESHYPGLLHSVDLCSPSLEISLHLNHSEFLVAIPLFCREKSPCKHGAISSALVKYTSVASNAQKSKLYAFKT